MIEHYRAAWDELIAPGAPFAMTDIEVRGVPVRVFAQAPPTMRTVWELTAGNGDAPYLVYEDEHLSYAEVGAAVRSLADHLHFLGIGSGDRVAVAMRNYPEWVISYWATISVGAALVGMNAWWTTPEMEYGLRDASPKLLIVDSERLERAAPVLDGLREEMSLPVIAVRHDGDLPGDASHWADVVRPEEAPEALPVADIDPDDDATIFYTSGTTGFPKGAQLTHRGSVHNLLHCVFMGQVAAAGAARATGQAPPALAGPPVIMAPTPLFHVTACNCLLHPATLAGGTLVLTYKWDAERALELIEREKVNTFSGVPTMARELLTHPDWERRDTSSLVGLGGGGAAVQPDLVAKIGESLRGGGPNTGYGLTETHGIVTANGGAYFLAKPESAGPVCPTIDARIVDDDGVAQPAGAVGALQVRGPVVIKGYLNKPEATAEAIVDGWFDTGDIARLDDDGWVYIVDRKKDMVLRGGENIYCSEVEAAIYTHEAVVEVAVFAVPDERLGEEVGAAVVTREGAGLDEEGLLAFLAERIARHKIPAHVWFLTEGLPRNANGKFVKRELKDKLLAPS